MNPNIRRLSILILFIPFFIRAADTLVVRMPRIVVTANRYEKEAFETHLQSSVLRGPDVWMQGISSLGDWLESAPGVSQVQTGPWSQKPVIRGLSGAHVLTLVDGMKLDVLRDYGDHAPLVDVNQIERIEIIRGPGSVLYGSNAVAGIVNIITRPEGAAGKSTGTKGRAGLQFAGVNNQLSETASLNTGTAAFSLDVHMTHRQADNIRTPSGTLKNTGFSGYSADLVLGFNPLVRHQIQVTGHITRMDNVGIPTSPYAETARFKDYDRNRASLHYRWQENGMFFSHLSMDAYYEQGNREFDAFLFHVPKGTLYVNQKLNAKRKVKTHGASVQGAWSITGHDFFTAGMDYFAENDDTWRIADAQVVNAMDEIKADPPPDRAPPTPLSSRRGLAAFMENEWSPVFPVTLNTGIRYDFIRSHAVGTPGTLTATNRTEKDHDLSGNLGTIIRISSDLRLTMNAGRAFKAPALQERFFRGTGQAGFVEGNPDLKSENSLNIDLGIRWKNGNTRLDLNVFQNRIWDFIVLKPVSSAADTFLYDNVGDALLSGAEADGQWTVTGPWTLFASAAAVRGRDISKSEDLPKIPPLNLRTGVRYEHPRGFWMGLSTDFVSRQDHPAPNEKATDGYALLHWNSGIQFHSLSGIRREITFAFNIHNLLNKKYRDHLSNIIWWNAPGRNITLNINWNF